MALEMKDPAEEVASVRFLIYEWYHVVEGVERVPVRRFPVAAVSTYLIPLTSTEPLVQSLLATFQARHLSELVFSPLLHPESSGFGRWASDHGQDLLLPVSVTTYHICRQVSV